MRIMIVSGHYSTDIGYQEVHLARAYVRQGHQVKVLTTPYVPEPIQKARPRTYEVGTTREEGYEIERLPIRLQWNTVLIPGNWEESITAFQPDVVISVAISKYMPVLVMRAKERFGFRCVSIFGDRFKDRDSGLKRLREKPSVWLRRIAFSYKRVWYAEAIRQSDLIVHTTPETLEFLRSELPAPVRDAEVEKRIAFIPLGFDPNRFYFDLAERRKIRAMHGIADNSVVFVTATKIEPEKRIEDLIDSFAHLISTGRDAHLFLIGFAKDAYSNALRQKIQKDSLAQSITCLPFCTHEVLRGYYSAADVGYWPREAISIQEAMGTGLKIVLRKDAIVSHLITESVNGFWNTGRPLSEDFVRAYSDICGSLDREERNGVVRYNQQFSYDAIARDCLDRVVAVPQIQSSC